MRHRTPAHPAGNLPAAVTSFVGRRREISEVRRLLSVARLVTLTGVEGVGKTRLAEEVAAASGRSFADGVWLVDLASVRDPGLVARAVVSSLGMLDQSTRAAEEQLVDHLAGRQVLVVLDNCEHLLDACAALCDRLLRTCARLKIVTTSRELLGGPGEHVYPVMPLSLPSSAEAPSSAEHDAPALLIERARAVGVDRPLTEETREAVVKLCERLDGIPLAIELAASHLRSLSLEEILERLEDRSTGGARTSLPRERTLRTLIDWSYELCSAEERLLWARLSVFAGGFTLEAAEGVCGGPDLLEISIMDSIDRLVAQSVVLPAPAEGPPRYRMLEIIREYGWRRLAEHGEATRLKDRHRDYHVELAERIASGWNGPGQEAALARLRTDHGNLQVALEWSTSRRDGARKALALVAALRYHWCADGFVSEGRRWIDRALKVAEGRSDCTTERIRALWVSAWVMLLQGDQEPAGVALQVCGLLARLVGDQRSRGWATGFHATSAMLRGQLAEAIETSLRAIENHPGEDDLVGMALCQLAIAQAHAGDEWASTTARRAIALADQHGERWSKSYALWALGFDARVHGELPTAAAYARSGLEIQRGFNDHVGTALMIELLTWIAAAGGEHRNAAVLLGAIRSIWRRIGTSIGAFGPHLAEQHTACEETVAAALPPRVLNAELARGERLEYDQAIAYALDGQEPSAQPANKTHAVLTAREWQVAELVAQGLSNRQIAEKLVVSRRTVDSHLENMLAKLGFTSRTQVAAWTTRTS
ncbi:MAG TPA: LuxR C-terminal-related transcriptional regulator [Amycolatopsis sp.]|uniref:ATP-binding protein n=1 Tax=Amycolatopsis sp. TaxID=37632 RepID=UPI002B475137|nr:LuxR C-terminal-related transcriptional regulator [Amycolatopsis sp.]HKS47735.1 LuxR C-terminal-related transcriptional regulator [Amycolatopsis sp.]